MLQKIIDRIYLNKFKHVDYFLPISRWCADSLESDYGIDKLKVSVCYPGIDLGKWAPSDDKVDNNKLQVLFVGNDLPRKGILDFFSFYNNRELNGVHFMIVSKDKSYLFNKPYISVLDNLNHDDLYTLIDIYRKSDIFLFPTKVDMLGHVLIEAASSGLPIIATNIAGISEIVEDQRNGFLIERENWCQFYEKIKFLRDNYLERIKMGIESRKIAIDKLSYQQFEKTIIETINRISSSM